MKKLLGILGSIGALIVILLAMGVGKVAGRSAVESMYSTDIEKTLVEVASKTNSTLPMMVDKETRLDTTMGGPGKKFSYFYTFPAYASTDVNPSDIHAYLSRNVTKNVCGSTDMKPLFQAGVTAVYIYRGNDGVEITRLNITPGDCGVAP